MKKITDKEVLRLSYDQILGVYVELLNSYLRKSHKFYDLTYAKFVMDFVKNDTKLCLFFNILYFKESIKYTFLFTIINEYKTILKKETKENK